MRRLTSFLSRYVAQLAVLSSLLVMVLPAAADGPASQNAFAPAPNSLLAAPIAPAIDGNRYLAQVLNNLEQRASIVAKIRYESRLQGQTLNGTGSYWQQRTENQRNTRWEIQMQIGDQTASYLQVFKKNYLWTEVRLPSGREVRGLDVAWLQKKLKTHCRTAKTDRREQALLAAVGQGGLRQMMSDLLRNFDFQPPQAKQLNGLPVDVLIGHWRPERLAQLWPAAAELADNSELEWPEQIPHHVLLMIDRRNDIPCVCEHRSFADAPLATSLVGLRPTDAPLLRYEIYEVRFAVAIASELFEYNPGETILIDEAPQIFEQLTAEIELLE